MMSTFLPLIFVLAIGQAAGKPGFESVLAKSAAAKYYATVEAADLAWQSATFKARAAYRAELISAIPEARRKHGASETERIEFELRRISDDFAGQKQICLTKVRMISGTAAVHGIMVNGHPWDRPILNVDGQPCNDFIYAHAPSRLTYAVPRGYTRFVAKGATFYGRSFSLIVEADGAELFRRELPGDGSSLEINVKLPRATRAVSLVADPMGDTIADGAVWAWPRFLQK